MNKPQYRVEGYESAGNRTFKSKWYNEKSDALEMADKIKTMWRVFITESNLVDGIPMGKNIMTIKND